jgi:hypothetical protein
MPLYLDTLKHRTPFGTYPQVAVDDTWPEPHHAAQDEIGQRVIDFMKQWSAHPAFPPSPWDERSGTIALIPLDEPRAATDEIPRYRMRETGFVGCNLFLAGQVTSFAGWIVNPWTVEAVNASAELVLAYQTKYGTNRKLSGQPYQSDGRLFFHNPALAGGPVSAVMRWAGAAS